MSMNENFQLKMNRKFESDTWTDFFLDEFEILSGIEINPKCRRDLTDKKKSLIWRFCLDFFICQFLLGPSVILFWRGVWDYAYYEVEYGYLKVLNP